MNEVSKCAEINFSSFDNLHFPLEGVNTEIWDLKATVRKFLLSSLEVEFYAGTFSGSFHHWTRRNPSASL